MREILFRGKRLDNGNWIEGYLFKIWEQAYIMWGTTNGIPNMVEVDPSTIGQFTGMSDKAKKRVFEDDILECYQKGESIRGRVAFEDGCFFVMFTNGQKAWIGGAIKQFKAKVIGNIHDNPDLLP